MSSSCSLRIVNSNFYTTTTRGMMWQNCVVDQKSSLICSTYVDVLRLSLRILYTAYTVYLLFSLQTTISVRCSYALYTVVYIMQYTLESCGHCRQFSKYSLMQLWRVRSSVMLNLYPVKCFIESILNGLYK